MSRTLGSLGLAVLCVSQFVDVLSVNTAVIALPDIRDDLGMSDGQAQWVISIYALLFGGLLLPGGWLADRVGHRRLFAVGIAGFALASLACGLAPSGGVLIAARALTGVTAALTVPAALALLIAGTSEERRPRALGWWTAAGGGGAIAGLVVGGVLTDVAGWRASFIAPAVLAAACLPLLGAVLDTGEPAPARRPRLADRRLLAGTLASATNTAATSPFAVLSAIYLQDVRGWSPAANGLSFVPFAAMVVVGSGLGAILLGRLGPARTLLLGAIGLVAMPLVACAGGEALLVVTRAGNGLGLGCAAVAATALGTASARPEERGFAAGLVNMATQLGTAVSVAAIVPLAGSTVSGLRAGFAASAAIGLVGTLAAVALLTPALRRSPTVGA